MNMTVAFMSIESSFPELSFDFQIDIPLLPKLPCFVTVSNSHIYTSFEFRKSKINGWTLFMTYKLWLEPYNENEIEPELPANDCTRWQIRFRWGLKFSLFGFFQTSVQLFNNHWTRTKILTWFDCFAHTQHFIVWKSEKYISVVVPLSSSHYVAVNTDEHYFYLCSSDEKCLCVHVSSAWFRNAP